MARGFNLNFLRRSAFWGNVGLGLGGRGESSSSSCGRGTKCSGMSLRSSSASVFLGLVSPDWLELTVLMGFETGADIDLGFCAAGAEGLADEVRDVAY